MSASKNAIDLIQLNFEKEGYICNSQIATAIYLSQNLNKPILVEGPPGVGKTELAKATSAWMNKSLIRLSNNGISGIINNNGSVIISTQLNNRKIINSTFEFKNENNLVLFHKIFNFLIILLFLTFIYFSLIKKK